MIVGAAGPYAASPIPTKMRVMISVAKVLAIPDQPLARLQTATPAPIKRQRENRSASQPKHRREKHVADEKRGREPARLRHRRRISRGKEVLAR